LVIIFKPLLRRIGAQTGIKNQRKLTTFRRHAGASPSLLLRDRRNGANRIRSLRRDFDAMNDQKDIPAAEKASELPHEAIQDLKSLREARGLSLNDVFAMTRVSLINLQAVESGDFDRLPPPVYARNFIRKYARAIGVDEEPLLTRYEKHLESLKPLREETEVRKPWPENGRRYRFLFISLAAVILAGILVYAIFLYDQSGKTPPSASRIEPTSSAQLKDTPPVEPPSAPQVKVAPPSPETTKSIAATPLQSVAPPPATASGKMHHLVIEARELTWVRITEDRNLPYQALLKPGDKIERMASEYFLLDIGNAGGLNLTFQGKNMGSLGKRGQIIHIRLPEKILEKPAERKTP
jgi:cytoskeleton protein RodZ